MTPEHPSEHPSAIPTATATAGAGPTTAAADPFHVRADPDERFAVLADGARTGGALGVVVCTWAPGAEPPPHTVARVDRALLVSAGSCRVSVDGTAYDVRPDDLVFVPRGARLAVRAGDDGCRMTVVGVPAGAEPWLATAARRDLPVEVLLGVAIDHGVVVHPR